MTSGVAFCRSAASSPTILAAHGVPHTTTLYVCVLLSRAQTALQGGSTSMRPWSAMAPDLLWTAHQKSHRHREHDRGDRREPHVGWPMAHKVPYCITLSCTYTARLAQGVTLRVALVGAARPGGRGYVAAPAPVPAPAFPPRMPGSLRCSLVTRVCPCSRCAQAAVCPARGARGVGEM
eukprot:COSAG04_NODE_7437_length_1128_cov_2.501458_2_plen_178_part_00